MKLKANEMWVEGGDIRTGVWSLKRKTLCYGTSHEINLRKELADIQIISAKNDRTAGGTAAGTVAGAVIAGPLGAIAGALYGGRRDTETVVHVVLRDGKAFVAKLDRSLLHELFTCKSNVGTARESVDSSVSSGSSVKRISKEREDAKIQAEMDKDWSNFKSGFWFWSIVIPLIAWLIDIYLLKVVLVLYAIVAIAFGIYIGKDELPYILGYIKEKLGIKEKFSVDPKRQPYKSLSTYDQLDHFRFYDEAKYKEIIESAAADSELLETFMHGYSKLLVETGEFLPRYAPASITETNLKDIYGEIVHSIEQNPAFIERLASGIADCFPEQVKGKSSEWLVESAKAMMSFHGYKDSFLVLLERLKPDMINEAMIAWVRETQVLEQNIRRPIVFWQRLDFPGNSAQEFWDFCVSEGKLFGPIGTKQATQNWKKLEPKDRLVVHAKKFGVLGIATVSSQPIFKKFKTDELSKWPGKYNCSLSVTWDLFTPKVSDAVPSKVVKESTGVGISAAFSKSIPSPYASKLMGLSQKQFGHQ
jgi:hypothetical protein